MPIEAETDRLGTCTCPGACHRCIYCSPYSSIGAAAFIAEVRQNQSAEIMCAYARVIWGHGRERNRNSKLLHGWYVAGTSRRWHVPHGRLGFLRNNATRKTLSIVNDFSLYNAAICRNPHAPIFSNNHYGSRVQLYCNEKLRSYSITYLSA